MKYKLCVLSFLAFFSLSAMKQNKIIKIKPTSIAATSDVGDFDLYHDTSGFTVVQDGKMFPVESHLLDPFLRTVDHTQLKKFQKHGFIQVSKNDNNQFSLISILVIGPGELAALFHIS